MTHHSKHIDHKEHAKKLQLEVDAILSNVDEKGLFGEFREHEIVDIHELGDKQVITESIEERIHLNVSRRHQPSIVLKQTEHVGKKVNSLVHYLFKPFYL